MSQAHPFLGKICSGRSHVPRLRPLPTRVTYHRSLPAAIPFSLPRYQYRMTLAKKVGKEGSTRWVAERDSLAGCVVHKADTHGHSVAVGGVFIPQHTVEGCLS